MPGPTGVGNPSPIFSPILILLIVTGLTLPALSGCLGEQVPTLVLATTTSTYDSGLLDYLLERYDPRPKVRFKVVAVGTGQALQMGRDGSADLLLVHALEAELEFMAQGHGLVRRELMYNRFVLAGPPADPANVSNGVNITQAFSSIFTNRSHFVSRGDDSGTHKKEVALWAAAGYDQQRDLDRADTRDWYHQTGQGMGASLTVANEKRAYILVDEGTWYSRTDLTDLQVLLEGDPLLFNQYGVILVNSTARPHTNLAPSIAFMDWLTAGAGQALIGNFSSGGRQLFTPNYRA